MANSKLTKNAPVALPEPEPEPAAPKAPRPALRFRRGVRVRKSTHVPLTPDHVLPEPPTGADHPVARLYWVHRDCLFANDYNPNHVPAPELELLAVSILEDGWTQPIVARTTGEIVDGFHRWSVSAREDVGAITGFYVPVVFLAAGKSRAEQMLSTIRHNRASGEHGVIPLADIVRALQEQYGLSAADIERRLGMEPEEVTRLSDKAGMPERVGRDREEFGKAYVPVGAENL